MTNRELSARIKNDLKAAGIDPRAVRVSVRDAGYSAAAHIRIMSPEVSAEAVRRILAYRESYDRDERTGEILAGANLYIFVEYADGIFDTVAQEWAATARGVLASKDETTRIFDGLYLINWERSGRLSVRQQNAEYSGNVNISGFADLCKYIYKFAQFGSIVA